MSITIGVYPRGGGGTSPSSNRDQRRKGLSPRGRGNRNGVPDAGEYRKQVYPRGGGGTRDSATTRRSGRGLSPRGRGNHRHAVDVRVSSRSIPAGAGEPTSGPWWARARRVYPRGGGGTGRNSELMRVKEGLSPRGRGNREHHGPVGAQVRSIPAGAGEPSPRVKDRRMHRVYPRGGGGTTSTSPYPYPGSIPAGAGEPVAPWAAGTPACGSIPAGAGEPPRLTSIPGGGTIVHHAVYPRGGGGTASNLVQLGIERGSIPAGAGEPFQRTFGDLIALGLSPRGRGNPRAAGVFPTPAQGSIPAGAGEPNGTTRNCPGAVGSIPAGAGEPRLRCRVPDRS